jgi:hypothetical protein
LSYGGADLPAFFGPSQTWQMASLNRLPRSDRFQG